MRTLNLTLTLAVGLLGGLLSRYVAPTVVRAQTQTPPPKEIRAQKFDDPPSLQPGSH